MTLRWHTLFWAVALWSASAPSDRLTWMLEAVPAIVIYGLLLVVRHRLRRRVTPLTAWLCLALAVIVFVGGHYGFAAVPGFEGPRPVPGGSGVRNEFDKLAHFFQGLVPAIAFRELLIRAKVLALPALLPAAVLALTLALSASYELLEWASYLALGVRAEAFVAAQGDPWDAQSDMATAALGASFALIALSRLHDAQLAGLARAIVPGGLPKNSFDKPPFRG